MRARDLKVPDEDELERIERPLKRYICLNEACSFELEPPLLDSDGSLLAKTMHEELTGHRLVLRDSPDPDEVGIP